MLQSQRACIFEIFVGPVRMKVRACSADRKDDGLRYPQEEAVPSLFAFTDLS